MPALGSYALSYGLITGFLLREAGYRLFVVNDSTAALESVATLDRIDEQNIIALPSWRW